jgi:hypothetical protein
MSSMKSCEGVLCTAYGASYSSYAPPPHTTALLSLVRVSARACVCVPASDSCLSPRTHVTPD